jgi:quercetin dioxygenase-like cupin family protein
MEGVVMPRAAKLFPLVLILIVGLVAGGSGVARAQDGTPAADETGMEGLSFTPLGWATEVTLPSPAYLEVARVGFAPGAGFPLDPSVSSAVMVVIESGEITATVVEQSWTVTRGAMLQQVMATPDAMPDMASVQEVIAMGAETTLHTGDAAYIPGSVSGEVRNAGEETATAIVFLIAPSGMMGEATPAP